MDFTIAIPLKNSEVESTFASELRMLTLKQKLSSLEVLVLSR
jgi:hypothetical protein